MTRTRLRKAIDALRLAADRIKRAAGDRPSSAFSTMYAVACDLKAEAYALEAELYRSIGDASAETRFNAAAALCRVRASEHREWAEMVSRKEAA